MMTAAQYFRGVVAAVYVAVCLMIAAVRWFHMCRPYDREPNYYYPARLTTTLIYLSSLILLPYVFRPDSPMAWLLVKAYLLPVNLYFMTALLLSYFGRVMHWKRWPHLLVLGIPALLALLAIPLLAGRSFGDGISGYALTSWIILVSGGVMTVVCLYAVWLVLQWTRTVSDEEYSNPNDYPVTFARKSVGMLLITLVLLWITALSDNPTILALVQLVLCVTSAWMLILALHPHRRRAVQEEQAQSPSPDADADTDGHVTVYNRTLTESLALSILSAISEVVLEQKAYLDPHLTLQDVADRTGYNRTYVASLFKTELGGFFNYINTQRLAYVESYRRDHPESSLSEAIAEAGFSSRTTYYSIKSRLKQEA